MKRAFWLFRLLITALLPAILFLSACSAEQNEDGYLLPVMLSLPDGVEVEAENPLYVAPGEDAVFTLRLAAGYDVRDSERYSYDYLTKTLTVCEVRYPVTIEVESFFDANIWAGLSPDQIPTEGEFDLSLHIDGAYGTAETIPGKGTYSAGKEITASATPNQNGRFVCWSVGAPVAKGGVPVAYTVEYTFRLGMDMQLYANFAAANTATILYDANGGITQSGAGMMREDSSIEVYITPHAMANQGQLRRDGYLLYAYNTAPDGSGKEYTFGANVPVGESGVTTLYAMWAEVDESIFTYIEKEGALTLTGCKTDSEIVVLPDTIKGKPVVRLAKDALKGLSKMTTLITSPTLERIEAGAVSNCPNFTTFYLCDSIKFIPDNFTANCPEFQTLKLGAVRAPTYMSSRNGTYAMKFQRLITAPNPKLVIISGSSSAYGIDSARMEEKLGYRYNVVNYGTNQGTPAVFFMEFTSHFVGKGDIVLQAPEPHYFQLGESTINTTTWQIMEGALEAFSYVDVRHYKQVFSSLTAFNESRSKMKPQTYQRYTSETVNQYGDFIKYKEMKPETYAASPNSRTFDKNQVNATRTAAINREIAAIRANGAEVFLSFSPVNYNSLNANGRNEAIQMAYQNAVTDAFDSICISTVADYIIEGKYFFNSDLHLGTKGSQIRSDKLAEQILAQLQKSGSLK